MCDKYGSSGLVFLVTGRSSDAVATVSDEVHTESSISSLLRSVLLPTESATSARSFKDFLSREAAEASADETESEAQENDLFNGMDPEERSKRAAEVVASVCMWACMNIYQLIE